VQRPSVEGSSINMRALVKTATGPGGLELRELPQPMPERGQVLLAVRAAALCGTDVHIAHGKMPVRPPLVLGHELAGVVAAVGPDVEGIAVGERVTTETDASFCGECAHCRAGNQYRCPKRTAIGTTSPGGLADFVAVPAGGIHPLPAGMDFAAGSLSEPLAVAVHAVVERGVVEPGEEVVVIGPGTVGLLAAQVAVAVGATVTVAGLARHGARFRLARELGIHRTADLGLATDRDAIAGGRDGLGVDVVIECSGAPDAVASGLRLLRKGGRLVLVAFTPGVMVPVDLDLVVQRELSIVASRGKRPSCFAIALDLMSTGRVRPRPLISHRFPLGRWPEAFETAARSGTKVVVEVSTG
jgi:L-iditol 2-dehydrogenase